MFYVSIIALIGKKSSSDNTPNENEFSIQQKFSNYLMCTCCVTDIPKYTRFMLQSPEDTIPDQGNCSIHPLFPPLSPKFIAARGKHSSKAIQPQSYSDLDIMEIALRTIHNSHTVNPTSFKNTKYDGKMWWWSGRGGGGSQIYGGFYYLYFHLYFHGCYFY